MSKESPIMRFLRVLEQCERRNVKQMGLDYPVILPNMFPSHHLENNEPICGENGSSLDISFHRVL